MDESELNEALEAIMGDALASFADDVDAMAPEMPNMVMGGAVHEGVDVDALPDDMPVELAKLIQEKRDLGYRHGCLIYHGNAVLWHSVDYVMLHIIRPEDIVRGEPVSADGYDRGVSLTDPRYRRWN